MYHLADSIRIFACSRYFIITQTSKPHQGCTNELDVVQGKYRESNKHWCQKWISSLIFIITSVEFPSNTWITFDVDIVEAVEDHKVDRKREEEEEHVYDGAFIDTGAGEDSLSEAAPVWLGLARSISGQFSKPEDEQS